MVKDDIELGGATEEDAEDRVKWKQMSCWGDY